MKNGYIQKYIPLIYIRQTSVNIFYLLQELKIRLIKEGVVRFRYVKPALQRDNSKLCCYI